MASIKRSGFTPAQNDTSNIFKALDHPARIAILEFLIIESVPCKYLEAELKMAKSTLSRHMQVLFDCGIIGYEKIINETYYSINPNAIDHATIFLSETLKRPNREINFNRLYFKKVKESPNSTPSPQQF
ncbi:MAG: metalloregulator ArsR/SmtB family transcription factor [Crocinitomicaceae bacterium]